VTILSKKIIFLLHRTLAEAPSHDPSISEQAAQRGREKLREVQSLYAKMSSELADHRYWRYQRQVSPGLQEYIEALSFTHYLDHGSLITFEQAQQTLCDASGKPVSLKLVPYSDLMHTELSIDGLRLFTRII
jgi:predicted translin family RNA/ssDNA-binding protein